MTQWKWNFYESESEYFIKILINSYTVWGWGDLNPHELKTQRSLNPLRLPFRHIPYLNICRYYNKNLFLLTNLKTNY
jgi:hypothetical protein